MSTWDLVTLSVFGLIPLSSFSAVSEPVPVPEEKKFEIKRSLLRNPNAEDDPAMRRILSNANSEGTPALPPIEESAYEAPPAEKHANETGVHKRRVRPHTPENDD